MNKHIEFAPNAPCKDCGNRTVDTSRAYTCHSDCAAYLYYRSKREAVYEARRKAVESKNYNYKNAKRRYITHHKKGKHYED